ncbi:hypothetical protein CS0771_02910 [Catellatospora sp. IY07-71]|uniref:hypothetical protein n=1 Tax=Catellatospora sp. IY07-71 TaxID=2728827 RepID=UPI001BB42B73|nr:hypothetical protein [Catellatospora sp. IY07-71]BCJ70747.1 hypothetical protein CS0771_02910 [Catellatospora sp. IY07-71]
MAKPKAGLMAGVVMCGLIGVLCIVIGFLATSGDSVKCADKTMEPGQKCLLVTDTETAWHTYDEMKVKTAESRQVMRIVFFGGGALFLLIAAGSLLAGRRESRREAQQVAAAQAWTQEG